MKFKFCPFCKGKFLEKGPNLLECESCGFKFYINPKPTTAVVLENSEGKILLVKRNSEPYKGMWDLPGGFIEPQETAEESARREIKEELGIEVGTFKIIGTFWSYYTYQNVEYPILGIGLVGKIKKPNFKINKEEIAELKFFAKNEIPLEKVAFKDVKEVLKTYLSTS